MDDQTKNRHARQTNDDQEMKGDRRPELEPKDIVAPWRQVGKDGDTKELPSQAIASRNTIAVSQQLTELMPGVIPSLIARAGDRAKKRFAEFFTAEIRNPNTRKAYATAVRRFCRWCEEWRITLDQVNPMLVAAHVEWLGTFLAPPSVKQSLAAIRMLFDYLVIGHAMEMNPASSVRGPRYSIKKGKTPVLTATETRQLLDSIPSDTIAGLRDKALMASMVYSFARVGAVVKMNVEDYAQNGKRCSFRLHEKGGKFHEVPAHHRAEELLDAYIAAAGIAGDKKGPLFRTINERRQLTGNRVYPNDVLRMVKRYARRAGLSDRICCHTFRATGITRYLECGGTIERAASIACHESTRTTQLYNRTSDAVSLDEIEKILI